MSEQQTSQEQPAVQQLERVGELENGHITYAIMRGAEPNKTTEELELKAECDDAVGFVEVDNAIMSIVCDGVSYGEQGYLLSQTLAQVAQQYCAEKLVQPEFQINTDKTEGEVKTLVVEVVGEAFNVIQSGEYIDADGNTHDFSWGEKGISGTTFEFNLVIGDTLYNVGYGDSNTGIRTVEAREFEDVRPEKDAVGIDLTSYLLVRNDGEAGIVVDGDLKPIGSIQSQLRVVQRKLNAGDRVVSMTDGFQHKGQKKEQDPGGVLQEVYGYQDPYLPDEYSTDGKGIAGYLQDWSVKTATEYPGYRRDDFSIVEIFPPIDEGERSTNG